MGMSEGARAFPSGQLRLRQGSIGGNQLDREFRAARRGLGEKDAAVVRATEIAAQWEHPVDEVPLPPGPDLARQFT